MSLMGGKRTLRIGVWLANAPNAISRCMLGKVATSLLLVSLATGPVSSGARIDSKCLEAYAAHAARNPRIMPLPPWAARPLGLPENHPYRQALIRDNELRHILAVDGPQWTSALIVRRGGSEGAYWFLVDRQGQLRRAIHAKDGVITPLSVDDSDVIRRFSHEVNIWLRAELVDHSTGTVRENPCSP